MAFICLFVYHEPAKTFTLNNPWIAITAFITMFVVLIIMACCGEMRRKTPHNFIFLALFTVAQGLMLGIVTIRYEANEVWNYLKKKIPIVLKLSNQFFPGSNRSWNNMPDLLWTDHFLAANQVGLYHDGRLPVCGTAGCVCVWLHCCAVPGQCCQFGLFRLWSVAVLAVPRVRHPDHDGWQAQVLDQPGGVHLCSAESVPGHYQHLLVYLEKIKMRWELIFDAKCLQINEV